MDLFYMTTYSFTWVLHVIAFYFAIITWKDNENLFVNSSLRELFKSPVEREFIAVIGGMVGNVAFMIVKPFYIFGLNGNSTGWMEPIFLIGHISVGVVLMIWHHKAYHDLREYNRETGVN